MTESITKAMVCAITMECSICFEDINRAKTLGCGHAFHPKCINQWIKVGRNRSCPLCRTHIAPVKNVVFNSILQKICYISGEEFERFNGNTRNPSVRIMVLKKMQDALMIPDITWETFAEYADTFGFNKRETAFLERMGRPPQPRPRPQPQPQPPVQPESTLYDMLATILSRLFI